MKTVAANKAIRNQCFPQVRHDSLPLMERVREEGRPQSLPMASVAIVLLMASLAISSHPAMAKAAHKSTKTKTETILPGGQKALGTFGKWRAFSFEEQGQTVCYMALPILAAKQKGFNRGASRLTITHRPSENTRDVVSFTAGYSLKPGSDVKINIGKASFSLFTAQSSAWTRDPATDRALATTLRHATSMTVTGTPAKQNASAMTDAVDLSGADNAYRAMSKACGIEVPIEKRPTKSAAKKTEVKKKKATKSAASKQESSAHAQPAAKHKLPSGHAPKVTPEKNKGE